MVRQFTLLPLHNFSKIHNNTPLKVNKNITPLKANNRFGIRKLQLCNTFGPLIYCLKQETWQTG